MDTGLLSLGLAEVVVWPSLRVGQIKSHVYEDKRTDLKATERILDAGRDLSRVIREFWPPNVIAIGVEGVSIPRKAAPQHVLKIGAGWGVLMAIAEANNVPIYQRFPASVKKFIAGSASASKEAVQRAVEEKHGLDFQNFTKGQRSHVADAVATGLCVAAQEKSIDMAIRMFDRQGETK